MPNSNSKAGTNVPTSTTADDITSSQTIAKPNVGCCTPLAETAMQKLKWVVSDGLNNFDESIKVSEIWSEINKLLEIEKRQIRDAFDDGQANYDVKCQDYKDGKDYYSKTFKKSIPVNLDFKDSICEGCGNYNMQCTCYEKSKDDHFNGLR